MYIIELISKLPIYVGEKHGVGYVLRKIWKEDASRESEHKLFQKDQKSNSKFLASQTIYYLFFIGTGKRGNRWSMITIRIGKFQEYRFTLN